MDRRIILLMPGIRCQSVFNTGAPEIQAADATLLRYRRGELTEKALVAP